MDNFTTPITDNKTASRNWLRIGIFSLVVLVTGAIVGSALTARGWSPFSAAANNPALVLPDNQPRVTQALTLNTGFAAVAKAVTPAVVVIRTQSRVDTQARLTNPFEEFFGPGAPDSDDDEDGARPRRRVVPPTAPKGNNKESKGKLVPTGTGSGVIITQDGYILTNNHVVEKAEKVTVELADRRIVEAKVIGADPPSDIAVIKIDSANLPTVPLGNSDQAEVGDIVLAVGNPLGIGQTVTMGIVSAKGRSTTSGLGRQSYEDFIQTDAPINRGNSGGALVNLKGELVGIPSQILSPSGGSIGIGFAIPTNMARRVMEQLIATGSVKRGMLGVIIRPLDPETAEQFGYKNNGGVLIDDVTKGLAAEKAGVKPGDIITEFEGKKVNDSNEFKNMVANLAPGSTVKLKVWRDSKEIEIAAKLADANTQNTLADNSSGGGVDKTESGAGEGVLSGVKVESITSQLSQQLNLGTNVHGVVVTEVDEDSAAAGRLGRGDVIQEINRQPINSAAEFTAAAKKAGNKRVLLYVQQQARTGARRGGFVTISPQE